MVVGLKGSAADEELVEFAFTAATDRECDLIAVRVARHTVPGATGLLSPVVDEATAQRRAEELLDDALTAPGSRHPGVHVRRLVERSTAARPLVSASLTAELVVVGRRHHPFHRLGPVTQAVLHRAGCSVAVVPLDDRTGPDRARAGARCRPGVRRPSTISAGSPAPPVPGRRRRCPPSP